MRPNPLLLLASVLALGAGACRPRGQLVFESVNPAQGRLSGGEELRIRGAGFEQLRNLEVRIGGRPATNVGIEGDNTIVLTTPEGREAIVGQPQDIAMLTPEGRSVILNHAFTYARAAGQTGGQGGGPNEDLRRRMGL